MHPGTIDPSKLFPIYVKMAMAHIGLISLVDLLRGKPKVGGLNLQIPAPQSVGVDHQVKGGDRLARGNFKGTVVGIIPMGRVWARIGGWVGLVPRARADPLGRA
jgi:hypothetical protein